MKSVLCKLLICLISLREGKSYFTEWMTLFDWSGLLLILCIIPLRYTQSKAQDEIARIRKRKRGRNMLNRSGNTTDNLCFRYRFRDVFSRFRCCVYNGTGPLFVHVSVKFQLKETNVSAIVISGLHLRKHKKTLRKHVFSMFPLTYSGLLNG